MAWRVPAPAVCPYQYSIYNWHSPPHPNSYTWKQHNNPGLTDVHIPFPYLLSPSDLEYSGLAAIAERSWPNTLPGNKGPHPSLSASRRHPIWPISASHHPRPLPKHEMARRRPPATTNICQGDLVRFSTESNFLLRKSFIMDSLSKTISFQTLPREKRTDNWH